MAVKRATVADGLEVWRPSGGLAVPVIVSSPHSGRHYPPELLDHARVDLTTLRKLEDSFVDELCARVPEIGATLITSRYARAYVDLNREAYELDASLLVGDPPACVNSATSKARAGLGTVPSRIGTRVIYRRRLTFAEIERRLHHVYHPYHQQLRGLLTEARTRFGYALLLDCHSMPTPPVVVSNRAPEPMIDIALGDRFGQTCDHALIAAAEAHLRAHGLHVVRNKPYAGGFITQHYGRPCEGVHALQIEIRRALYMAEATFEPLPTLPVMAERLRGLVENLAATLATQLTPFEPERIARAGE